LRQSSLEEILRRGDVHLDPPAIYYCPYTPTPSIAFRVAAPACAAKTIGTPSGRVTTGLALVLSPLTT
jgi:hypothetical protein